MYEPVLLENTLSSNLLSETVTTTNSESKPIVVDTFAWIEYFKGTERGKQASKFIDNPKFQLFTLDACMAELRFWGLTENYPIEPILKEVQLLSFPIASDLSDWLLTAIIKFERRKNIANIGLVDCLVIHHSRKLNAKILTGDSHFKKEKNAVMI